MGFSRILLQGTDLVWTMQAESIATQVAMGFLRNIGSLLIARHRYQITLQPSNPADLRQQWTFVAHALV
ncbi:hypothetical protein SISNIDRAFT_449948 [Sistotremastrum niveocremeum HHB9708]|uniref:Uncharacterized protein n=1 Tax=Sistotremastrum niveocremeum HHB9708 TaxID=1314777 RepID=A0A164YRY1_9AGAM|nr:hypothetical protein SISNIDRAFT_449948 [Sistotremastrum niveocremeum HHB9708]